MIEKPGNDDLSGDEKRKLERQKEWLEKARNSNPLEDAQHKLDVVREWVDNPTLNEGHLENLTNDSFDYLCGQEKRQKLGVLINIVDRVKRKSERQGIPLLDNQIKTLEEKVEKLTQAVNNAIIS
jgi:hypothetical protein